MDSTIVGHVLEILCFYVLELEITFVRWHCEIRCWVSRHVCKEWSSLAQRVNIESLPPRCEPAEGRNMLTYNESQE